MNDFDFTTQYVSGMTQIPVRTIQDYVSSFRESFSETAKKPVKGRRFLMADIDKLQTIKRLRAERVPDDEIRKILEGELPFKLAHQFSEIEIKNMAKNSMEIFAAANEAIEKAEETLSDVRRVMAQALDLQQQTRQENISMRNQLNSIGNELRKFREWQLFVMKYDPELNPYKQDDLSEPHPEKGKGFIGKLLGG